MIMKVTMIFKKRSIKCVHYLDIVPFIADNNLGFKAYASFGKNEISERIAVLVDLVKLVWNDEMFI